ncbi:MAG TPA: ion transporter [Flavobacterium sp.]|nr:ion transporter [Flavobacterium sp.]
MPKPKKTAAEKQESKAQFKKKLHEIIFGTSTKQGRKFDIYLLWFILLSIFILIIESLPNLSETAKVVFYVLEVIVSVIFVTEYLLRIYISPKPLKYILSVWGIVDLLAILPVLLMPFTNHAHFFRIIRILRLIRVFKIFRINKFTREAYSLYNSLVSSIYKISVFMFFVVMLAVIMGGLMFMLEGETNYQLNSIPKSIYWAIVTITTVGFGDVTPITNLGKFFASIMMLLGYAIIAVPTGIVSLEMFRQSGKEAAKLRVKCPNCTHANEASAVYCSQCSNAIKA